MARKIKKITKQLKEINKNYLFIIPAFFVVSFSYFHDKSKNTSLVAQSMPYNSDGSMATSRQKKTLISNKQNAPSRRQKEFTNSYLYATPPNEQKPNRSTSSMSGLLASNSSNMAIQKKRPPESLELPSQLQVGGNYTHVNLNPEGESSFHGNLGGLQGSYIYRPANNLYAGATLTCSQGNMTGITGSRFLFYIDTQEKVGYTFASAQKKWLMSLFSGLGYRFTAHHIKTSTGASLRYRYNEIYVPVGFLSTYLCSSRFSWGLGATWMPQVFPTVSISTQKGNNWSLSYKLANFYAEMPLTFAVSRNKNFIISLTPFYQRWNDGHTTAKPSTGLSTTPPSNAYNFWGADLNLGYAF